MLKKLNTKALGLLLTLLLAGVVFMIIRDNKKGSSTFNKDLVQIDTSLITSMQIFPKSMAGESIDIEKNSGNWLVKINESLSVPADMMQVNDALSQMGSIQVSRLAATNSDKWRSFEVGDSATRVVFKEGDQVVVDMVLGKISYVDQRTMLSYVRLNGEQEVYAVIGFIGMAFNRNLTDWRNKTVINIKRKDIKTMFFDHTGNDSFSVSYVNKQWMLDSVIIDSSKVFQYFNVTNNISSTGFVDDVTQVNMDNPPKNVVFLLQDNSTVNILAYFQDMVNDSTPRYIITSDQNPSIYFDGNQDNLFSKIFVNKDNFLSSEDE